MRPAENQKMTEKPRLIGYIRVSKSDQNLDLQADAMKAAGVDKVYQDKISGVRWGRKNLDAALAEIGPGEKLAVWRIDRLGRSIVPILTIVDQLEARNASVISLSESCDTATSNGKMQAIFLAVVAQMEWEGIRRRTQAGIDAAARRGKQRGGKPKMTAKQTAEARHLMRNGMTADAVAAHYKIGRATLFRHVNRDQG